MRVIDRLLDYLKHEHISPYTFEKACGIANGYLKKQQKGKGSVGSEILEKIILRYPNISLNWLITGKGPMIREGNYGAGGESGTWLEDETTYSANNTTLILKEKLAILENSLADKEKIIRLLEKHQP